MYRNCKYFREYELIGYRRYRRSSVALLASDALAFEEAFIAEMLRRFFAKEQKFVELCTEWRACFVMMSSTSSSSSFPWWRAEQLRLKSQADGRCQLLHKISSRMNRRFIAFSFHQIERRDVWSHNTQRNHGFEVEKRTNLSVKS